MGTGLGYYKGYSSHFKIVSGNIERRAKFSPPAENAPIVTKATESVKVIDSTLARGIKDGNPTGKIVGNKVESKKNNLVYFWTKLKIEKSEQVFHVWSYQLPNEKWKIMKNKKLKIPATAGYRFFTGLRLSKEGNWKVEALDQDGNILVKRKFSLAFKK